MHFVLLFLLVTNAEKAVDVRFTETAPNIDGIIEDLWLQADSAYDFVQHIPYEKTSPTERTVVYVLQDHDNLYFAFRCYAEKHKPIACFTTDEDYVRVSIDPFGSKTTGYYFLVFASQLFWDGWIFDDGRTYDDSWEGVWYRGVKIHDDHFIVEMKIPFKSIRYKKGLTEWGVQFFRHQAHNHEDDFWTEVAQADVDMVSRWGTLKNMNPQSTGYYFELYPEAYLRLDKRYYANPTVGGIDSSKTDIKPSVSMNLKWDVTPQTTINATAYPDFAQIESDPFTVNLSRYPTYLDERRPFFLEGRDIFRMSDLGENGGRYFFPLEIFYSRRVGKSLDGDVVPILGGLKVTNNSEKLNIGILGAYTDEFTITAAQDTFIEPDRWFGVLRARRSIMENSDIGVLFSGSAVDRDNYNYALGIEGVYRSGNDQVIVQGAFSDSTEKRGWALTSGYRGFIGNFYTKFAAEIVHDSFSVNDIGFVPWAGRKRVYLFSGPGTVYREGFLRWLYIAPGIHILQEPGDSNWSKLAGLQINPSFRNRWGMGLDIYAGKYYEADTNYFYRSVDFSVWGLIKGNNINFGSNYSYSWNYRRNYLAHQMTNWFFFGYSIIPPMSIVLSGNLWVEWDTTNTIVAMSPRIRPRLDIRFSADKSLAIFNDILLETPGTDIGETEFMSNRFGFLFSWNFLPKSWLHIALNDYREHHIDKLEPVYTIGAFKIRYLLYF
ncbi:MAG: carbohydrate binding family 9 domain-containing protein [candidate division WOR-3 bacterium]|nr:MAG: carbohydrate binding family 9 domain-containing protein [candidate division WOR-3 bacterium]